MFLMVRHYHSRMLSAPATGPATALPGGNRIAFFGGSFDPPHCGHLAVARAAVAALHLDHVLFAPVGAQPLKPQGSTALFPHRVAMTCLAIAEDSAFSLSFADAPTHADGSTPNYTIDTLERLHAQLPPGSQLFCLMGADSFLALRRWHRGAEIPFAAQLIVASRPGQSLAHLAAALPAGLSLQPAQSPSSSPPGASPDGASPHELRSFTLQNAAGATTPFHLLPGLHIPISASQIRQELRAESPAAAPLIPPAVARYIARHNLYR